MNGDACLWRIAAGVCLLAMGLLAACDGRPTTASTGRVIVLGFDGVDYHLTRDLMDRGRLPAFVRIAKTGSFGPLATTVPPQSPVAWSSFITALDPGGHGIFDFIHRNPASMTPYLSTSRTEPPRHVVPLGPWRLPLTGGRVELLRRGTPFWEALRDRGVDTTIVRMPANFPPSGTATRELSGMGTPDLLGTYGTFSYFTSDPVVRSGPVAGGVIHFVEIHDGVVRGELEGPADPLRRDSRTLVVPLAAHLDASRRFAKVVVGDEERLLRAGEWSDWIPVRFPLAFGDLRAQVRLFLQQVEPEFALYVSPPNVDPLSPALPVSSPASFAADLARATGRFYTQGMPEDTNARKAGVLSVGEFLQQARIAGDETERQYFHVLDRFEGAFLFYYFGGIDQVSHMLWHAMDPEHPAYDPIRDAPYSGTIAGLYEGMDRIVAQTLTRLGPDDLLVVMSDHGFVSWRRSFNLNAWLRDRGYLHLRAGAGPDAGGGSFEDIDWTRTRAYGIGLNALYVNLRGRESTGTVQPSAREGLLDEIAEALRQTLDPATGGPVVTRVFRGDRAYSTGGGSDTMPDLVIGYAKGTRASDESALGAVAPDAITDNRTAWTGDHCMDPAAVPGILLTSRALRRTPPALQELAPALLAELGVAWPRPATKEH